MTVVIPRISVILPCYNHQCFLEERIKSVLRQTLPVSQIIFLDDASTDGSLEIAKGLLSDSSVEVEFHSNRINSGSPFTQWNKGLRLAKHPYIWIAETDDTCAPHFLAELYSRLAASSSSVLAFSQSRYIDDYNHDLGSAIANTEYLWPGQFAVDFKISGFDFISTYLAAENAIPNASAVLFRRSAFQEIQSANESMRYAGDWDFWIRIAKQGNVVFLSEELNCFRCHKDSTRSKGLTARVSAERLACSARALFPHNDHRVVTINATSLIKLICQNRPNSIRYVLRALPLKTLPRVYLCYSSLASVPVFATSAWLVIGIYSLYIYSRRKLLIFNNHLSSLLGLA